MKIDKIEIESFGGLKDLSLDLTKGFQVVYGNNEDGKSTIMAFIKMMFYSKITNSRDLDKNPRLKYRPWDNSPMGGAVEFTKAGEKYRIVKVFGGTPMGDQITLINLMTGESHSFKEQEVGQFLFGLSLSDFERCGYISQSGAFLGAGEQLGQRLLENTISSGEENASQGKVFAHLDSAIQDMRSKRGDKGILVEAGERLQLLKEECRGLEEEQRNQESILAEYRRYAVLNEEYQAFKEYEEMRTASRRLSKVQALAEEAGSYETRKKELEKLGLSIVEAGELSNALIEAERNAQSQKQSYERLLKVSEGEKQEDSQTVTEEEYKAFQGLSEQSKRWSSLVDQMREGLIPDFSDWYDTTKAAVECEEQICGLGGEKKRLEPGFRGYQEALSRLQEAQQKIPGLKEGIESKKQNWLDKIGVWREKEQMVKERIEVLEMNVCQNSEMDFGNEIFIPMCVGAILAVICLIAGLAFSPLFHMGTALGLFLFAASALQFWKNKNRKKDDGDERELETAKQSLADLVAANEELKLEYEREIVILEAALERMEEAVRQAQEDVDALKDASSSYQEIERKLSDLHVVQEQLKFQSALRKKNLDKYKANPALSGLLGDFFDKNPGQIGEVLQDCLEKQEEYERKLSLCLINKKCRDEKEYEQKYHDFASERRNREAIHAAKMGLEEAERAFIALAKPYTGSDTYEKAAAFTEELTGLVKVLMEQKKDLEVLAKSLELEGDYTESALRAASDLEAAAARPVSKYFESISQLSEYEFNERFNQLKENNYQELLLELTRRLKTPERDIATVEREIALTGQELEEKQEYYDALVLARQTMEEAAEELRQNFAPELNRRTEEIFGDLTSGKYDKVIVTKDFDMKIRSGIHLREWKYLSSGTVDQAYLSLRLAISEQITENNDFMPVFLDDVLAQYDDKRLDNALEFFKRYCSKSEKDCQIILFTCHRNICDRAKGLETPVFSITR